MPTVHPLPVLDPLRLRRIPRSFAWIDHRLRTSDALQALSPEGLGLYLFLALAADAQGLSCWRLERVQRAMPGLELHTLRTARQELIRSELIAYRPWSPGALDGCYQLLALPPEPPPRRRCSEYEEAEAHFQARFGTGVRRRP